MTEFCKILDSIAIRGSSHSRSEAAGNLLLFSGHQCFRYKQNLIHLLGLEKNNSLGVHYCIKLISKRMQDIK